MGKGEEGIHMQLTAKQGGGAKFGARRGRKVVGFQIALSTTSMGTTVQKEMVPKGEEGGTR